MSLPIYEAPGPETSAARRAGSRRSSGEPARRMCMTAPSHRKPGEAHRPRPSNPPATFAVPLSCLWAAPVPATSGAARLRPCLPAHRPASARPSAAARGGARLRRVHDGAATPGGRHSAGRRRRRCRGARRPRGDGRAAWPDQCGAGHHLPPVLPGGPSGQRVWPARQRLQQRARAAGARGGGARHGRRGRRPARRLTARRRHAGRARLQQPACLASACGGPAGETHSCRWARMVSCLLVAFPAAAPSPDPPVQTLGGGSPEQAAPAEQLQPVPEERSCSGGSWPPRLEGGGGERPGSGGSSPRPAQSGGLSPRSTSSARAGSLSPLSAAFSGLSLGGGAHARRCGSSASLGSGGSGDSLLNECCLVVHNLPPYLSTQEIGEFFSRWVGAAGAGAAGAAAAAGAGRGAQGAGARLAGRTPPRRAACARAVACARFQLAHMLRAAALPSPVIASPLLLPDLQAARRALPQVWRGGGVQQAAGRGPGVCALYGRGGGSRRQGCGSLQAGEC